MNALYKIIPFNVKHGNCGGSLVQFQQGDTEANALPFTIGKVLVMSDIRTDDVRGMHAHYETEEILVALTGGCVVDIDDGCGRNEQVRLTASAEDGGRKTEDRGQKPEDSPSSVISSQPSGNATPGANHPPLPEGTPILRSATRHCADIKEAILLYPHVWRTMRDFEPGTTLMVVANIKYDEKDYIRDRAEFERIAKEWKGLGGSAAHYAGE